MNTRDPEYDRFGPWALEISDADPPPPLFVPHLVDDHTPLLSIKIPRQIERRQARPGMHLYDYLVTLGPDTIRILERVNDEVLSMEFRYREIQCLLSVSDLLAGEVRLVMPEKTYRLPFNTVSDVLMARMVGLIRERYNHGAQAVHPGSCLSRSELDLSFYYKGVLNELERSSPGFQILAGQPEVPVGSHESRGFRRLLFGILGKTLLESLHLYDGTELRILSRGRPYSYRGLPVYNRSTLFLPISKLREVVHEDSGDSSVTTMILRVDGGEFRFLFLRENTLVEPYLSNLRRMVELAAVNRAES